MMKKSAVILILVLATVMLIAGCGSSGSSVVGVYKLKTAAGTAVLTLNAGNKGTYSLSDTLAGLPVTYKVKNGTVVLYGADGAEIKAAHFKVVPGGLSDLAGSIYKKQ
jgi:hypothetical protein